MTHKALLILLAAFGLLGGCQDVGCGNRIVSRHPDSASDLVAYVFSRNCGATTDYSTNVAIGRRGENPSEALVVFTGAAKAGDPLPGPGQNSDGTIWLRAVWVSPRTLSIAYAEGSDIFRSEPAALNAKIQYHSSGPPVLPLVP